MENNDDMKTPRDPHYCCCNLLQLKPFCHQVAGHSSMLQLDNMTLCKPLNSREKRFYENIPTDLKKFTPQYRGMIYVTVEEDQDGYVNLLADSPPHHHLSSPTPSPSLTPTPSPSSTSSTSTASFVTHSCRNITTTTIDPSPHHHPCDQTPTKIPAQSSDPHNMAAVDPAGPCCSSNHHHHQHLLHRNRPAPEDVPTQSSTSHTCPPYRRTKSCKPKILPTDSTSDRVVKLKATSTCGSNSNSGSGSGGGRYDDTRYDTYSTGSSQRLIFEDDKLYLGKDSRKGGKGKGVGHNPWSLRMHNEQLKRMRRDAKSHRFILLENVVSQLQFPCILDLKMGTRLHGDDAPKEKRERQIAKCNSSTSSKLGVRISGMQVHQVTSGKYLCRNKYYCRQFSVDDFMSCIRLFLHNGLALRRDIIRKIISLLNELLRRLESHHTFRFYSSSLLIMYEGHEEDTAGDCDCCGGGNNSTGEDDDRDVCCRSCQGAPEATSSSSSSRQLATSDPKVNVKMIDFAHVTYQGFHDDPEVHNGPDSGYLFGLKNLIRILSEIFKEDDGDSRTRLWEDL